MGNNVREREDLKVKSETMSMWTYILNNRPRFTNKYYSEHDNENINGGIIKSIPITEPHCLNEWREFFYRWCEFGYQAKSRGNNVQ